MTVHEKDAQEKYELACERSRSQKIGFRPADLQERDMLRKTRFKLRKKGR